MGEKINILILKFRHLILDDLLKKRTYQNIENEHLQDGSNNILAVNECMCRISQNMPKGLKNMSDRLEILDKRVREMCQEIESRNDEKERLKETSGRRKQIEDLSKI